MTGHTLGAAGACEAAFLWLTLHPDHNPQGRLPPHVWDGAADPAIPPLALVGPDARLPDPLTDVEATIRLDPRGVWIDDLTGRCGPAELQLSAELQGYTVSSPCQIDLTAKNLNLDRLTVAKLPVTLQKVWQEYAPRGVVDVQTRLLSDGRT